MFIVILGQQFHRQNRYNLVFKMVKNSLRFFFFDQEKFKKGLELRYNTENAKLNIANIFEEFNVSS